MTYRPSNTRGVPDYKYPQNTSPALRLNEGHKLADFYSATTASCGVSVVQYCSAFYREQTVDIDGSDRQLIWDYTFTVSQTVGGVTTTWQVAVIDVDLNNDNDLNDTGEDGYFLVFPDGLPPADTNLSIGGIVANTDFTPHTALGGYVVCFAEGTLIDTKDGPRAIETLEDGDMIETRDGGLQPLR